MYDALYQARSTAINGTSLDAFVPQIFGDVPVKITRFIGSIPTVIGMGWVLFQGGDPAYPVWTGLDFSNDRSFITTGIPAGGVDGQVLTKQSDDNYAADWETIDTGVMSVVAGVNVTVNSTDPAHPVVIGAYQIPVGGTTNQVLAKNSNTDRDLKWSGPMLPLTGGTLTGGLVGTTSTMSGVVATAGITISGNNSLSFPTWGGGWFMNDATWIRAVANKNIYTGGALQIDGQIQGGSFLTSGAVRFVGAGETVRFDVAGAYLAWYNGATRVGYIQGNTGQMAIVGEGGQATLQAGSYYFNANSSGTHAVVGHIQMAGYNIYANAHMFDSDTGWWSPSDGAVYGEANGLNMIYFDSASFRLGVALQMQGNAITLYATGSDTNHMLQYSAATPASSGEASNGPMLQGYSSVWLHTVNSNSSLFLGSAGHAFLSPGKAWTNFSSRQFKENIVALDPADCLAQVLAWRPVEFDFIERNEHSTGFISEEMVGVTPTAVVVTGDDNEQPGWAQGIAYAMLTTQLAGAVQALSAEIQAFKKERI